MKAELQMRFQNILFLPVIQRELNPRAYLRDLNLTWEQLAGSRVLDLTANNAYFARRADQLGITVVSMDKKPDWWNRDKNRPKTPFALGDLEALPFAEGSFDLVVTRYPPHDKYLIEAFLKESKRVLRPGGELRFGPDRLIPVNMTRDMFVRMEQLWEQYTGDQSNFDDEQMAELAAIQEVVEAPNKLLESIDQQYAGYPPGQADFVKDAASLQLLRQIEPALNMIRGINPKKPAHNVTYIYRKPVRGLSDQAA